MLTGTGTIGYVSGSLHAFGNNGTTPSGGSVDSGSDTALNNDFVQDGGTFISASTLYGDLTTASDHLPAVADYTIVAAPTIGSLAASPATAAPGTSITLAASSVATGGTISSVNFYRETNGTPGLSSAPIPLSGPAPQSGSSWSIDTSTNRFSPGSYTYYAVANDNNGNASAIASSRSKLSPPPRRP